MTDVDESAEPEVGSGAGGDTGAGGADGAEGILETVTALRARAREQIPRVVTTPDPSEPGPVYERSPISVWRLCVASLVLLGLGSVSQLLPRTADGLEQDIQVHVGPWAQGVGVLFDAIATACAVLVIALSIGAAVIARRPRQLLTSSIAAALAACVVLVAARVAGMTAGEVTFQEWELAVIAAAIAVGAASFSVFSAPIVRWASTVITVCTMVGVLGDAISLVSRLMVIVVGEVVGSLAAVVFGTASRQVTRIELVDALERARLPVADIARHDGDARGSQPWIGTLRTGREVFVKVEAVDELRAAQLFRLWRRIRLKAPGDERAPTSARRSGEHEAFVAERARAAGVRTPALIGIGVLDGDRGVFTVFEAVDGTTFDATQELSDQALRSAWSQIQILRRAGIAHRDLRAANLMCAEDDVWVIDFGFSEVAAPDTLLQRDAAEFLASSAAIVGPERAVRAAVTVLGADDLAESIEWIQPLAVSSATRSLLSKADFADLRERVRAAGGVSAPELPQLQRVTWKGVAVTLALGVAIWTLLPQFTSGIDWSAALRADARWATAALVASVLTYVGAALSITGSVAERVPLVPTFFAQLASSFTNRVTPAKVGGLALNLRFLTKQGIDSSVAAAGLAVSTAAGTVVHVAITLVIVLWAGNTGFPGISAPPAWVAVVAVVVLAAVAGVLAAVPPARRWWTTSAWPSLQRSLRAFVEVIRSPRNLTLLLGGSAIVTIANLVAFYVSTQAFGAEISFASVGVVYLAGSALASAAPTPGGLGATEAALVAGLAVVGVPDDESVPAVLLFRLATFWIPILPGWISLTVLQRRGDL